MNFIESDRDSGSVVQTGHGIGHGQLSEAVLQRAHEKAKSFVPSKSNDRVLRQRLVDLEHERHLAHSKLQVTMEYLDKFDEEYKRIEAELSQRAEKGSGKDKGKAKDSSESKVARGRSPVKASREVEAEEESSSDDIEMAGSGEEMVEVN